MWPYTKNEDHRSTLRCKEFMIIFVPVLLLLQSVVRVGSSSSSTSSMSATTILETCPSVCFCDETNYVNCVGDGLWEVPTDIPRTVVRLELRNYIIGVLTTSTIQDLVELLELKLQQTKIQTIENGTFSNLTRLLRLDLSQNHMEKIGNAMFEGLTSLRYLDLSTNKVVDMDEAFVDLVNLEQLNLRDNLLPQLSTESFAGLYKVQYLNLDSNRIESIEVGTFQYLTNLAHLIVSNNPLTTLSRLDFFGSRLQYIDVSKVGLQRVPQSLTRYVRDLRLAKNNLTHIRLGDFDSYPYLSLLVLDDNFLEDIESDALGRQEYLMRLWLNGNRLQQIPTNLPPSLRVLYVEENLLKMLAPFSFQGMFNLEQLFLQRNQIKRLDPCAFCDLLSLRHLDLQANLLETISEGAFANLSSLISLDLSQNPLKTLPDGCFYGLDILKTLQLSRMKTQLQFEGSIFNPLKKLETFEVYDSPAFASELVNSTRALQGLRSLRELNIMHNNLATLRADFPNFFPQLKVAKLGGNQWNCDQNILWLTNWIKKAETHFYHSYSIRCSQPNDLLYKPIMMLKTEDVVLQQSTTTTKPAITTTAVTTELVSVTLEESSTTKTTTATLSPLPIVSKSNTPITANSSKAKNNESEDFGSQVSTRIPTTSSTVTAPITASVTTTFVTPTTTVAVTTTSADITITTNETIVLSTPTAATMEQMTMTSENLSLTSEETSSTNVTNSVTEYSSSTITDQLDDVSIEIATINTTVDLSTEQPSIHSNDERKSDIVEVPLSKSDVDFTDRSDGSVIVVAATVATGLGLLLLALTFSFLFFRYRKGYASGTSGPLGLHCQMRRSSSSISYSPQRDEVSIVTVSEGTVGLHTLTHQGLSNKLYFVLENSSETSTSRDISKDALPDPSLCELLPDTSNCYSTVRQARVSAKKARTYCFTK